nr:DUF1926 domain-containing protein [Gemmatimonadales bacterium]
VQLSRLDDALAEVPSGGLAYLPTASYREMEGWSLPPDAALRLTRLERDLGDARVSSPEGALIRGAHWRNFLVKYSESNRMHKKMQALSALCRRRGDPPGARRAIGRAQCNDAYWHGVFGGLYLPHLREAIWRNLAQAESELRAGEPIGYEIFDLDGDGHDELWIHSSDFSAIVSPWRGAALEEYSLFRTATNYADTLTRRREAYHVLALEHQAGSHGGAGDGTPSIHDIEHGIRLEVQPPVDADDRAMFVDRVLPAGLRFEDYEPGDYWAARSWARTPFTATPRRHDGGVEIVCDATEGGGLRKVFRFTAGGTLQVSYEWDVAIGDPGDVMSTELSLFAPLLLRCEPEPERWQFTIETLAKSERGLDRTRQGESVTLRWPMLLGRALLEIEGPAGA